MTNTITQSPYYYKDTDTSSIISISSGSNGITWSDIGAITNSINPNSLQVMGQAKFHDEVQIEKDITIKGKSLSDTLAKIEERLNILTVDPELEGRWQELKELGDKYRELEAYILSKERLVSDLMKDYHID